MWIWSIFHDQTLSKLLQNKQVCKISDDEDRLDMCSSSTLISSPSKNEGLSYFFCLFSFCAIQIKTKIVKSWGGFFSSQNWCISFIWPNMFAKLATSEEKASETGSSGCDNVSVLPLPLLFFIYPLNHKEIWIEFLVSVRKTRHNNRTKRLRLLWKLLKVF